MIRDVINSVEAASPTISMEQIEHLKLILPKLPNDRKLILKAKLNVLGK